MLTELGLSVARAIPVEHVIGLATGNLSLHGGVIRDAGGRIVSHLAMPASASLLNGLPGGGVIGSIVNGIQLHNLSTNVAAVKAATDQILNYSITTAALSGLGLVTSVTGFAFLASRLKRVDQRLSNLEKQTKSTKQMLQSAEHAKLMTAVDHLRLSQQPTDAHTRRHLLLEGKARFTDRTRYYKDQLEKIDDLAELSAIEDYYVLACLGSVMATSDLGFSDAAQEEMQRHYADWRAIARKHCGKLLLGDEPARLLDARYIQSVPTANLIRFLDFTNDTNRGIRWFDDLRQNLGKTTLIRNSISTIEPACIEYANKLLIKDDALQGFNAHMGFLAEKKLSLTSFGQRVEELRQQENAKFLVLEHKTPA